MSDSNVLKEMADLTMLSGKINPLQEHNLKMFPLVFFDGVSSVNIDYDLTPEPKVEYEQNKSTLETKITVENKHSPKVKYFISLDETKENTFLDKRFSVLETAVRKIFWSNTKVMIYFNDRLVFESKNV